MTADHITLVRVWQCSVAYSELDKSNTVTIHFSDALIPIANTPPIKFVASIN